MIKIQKNDIFRNLNIIFYFLKNFKEYDKIIKIFIKKFYEYKKLFRKKLNLWRK